MAGWFSERLSMVGQTDTTVSTPMSRSSFTMAEGSGKHFGSNLKSPSSVQWKKSTTITSSG